MTLKRYWPWWVALGWLAGYELYVIAFDHTTLSRMVWQADDAWPLLELVTGLGIVVLFVHFFYRNRRRP